MPSAGYSHFYYINLNYMRLNKKVSMPSAGYSHFYISPFVVMGEP